MVSAGRKSFEVLALKSGLQPQRTVVPAPPTGTSHPSSLWLHQEVFSFYILFEL